jgi:hypothetical protein
MDLTVHNVNHRPLRFATVLGHWGDGAKGRAKCTTDATGRCALLVQDIPNSATKVTFTITDVKRGKAQYQPVDNHWGKKSGATTLKIKKPKEANAQLSEAGAGE